MTRLQRSASPPRILQERGLWQTAFDLAAHGAGALDFKADAEIYGHISVKRALGRMQGNRCAYCEVNVKPAQPGHVDHFRPVGSVKQADGAPRSSPGYFWLAYAWENLFLACFRCNTSHKRDLFPLRQPHLRVQGPGLLEPATELLFIHPVEEEPRDHLRYHGAVAVAVRNSDKGVTMRNLFRLNRDRNLIGNRREYLELFENTVRVAESDLNPRRRAQAEALVSRMLAGECKYLAMIRDAFRIMVDGGEVVRLAGLRPAG